MAKPYAERAKNFSNVAAKSLLEVMERKQTNLCVSVDVTKTANLLRIVAAVAPFVCLIKTHVDVIEDFDPEFIDQLKSLSTEHDFLIFEDRKFADIGNTVSLQYSSGIHKIASWAHITNAHPIPGPGIIEGLASVGLPLDRGLLLLSEMSSTGTLATGFIAMKGISKDADTPPDEDFLILTPGVGLDVKGDALGQQYRTPQEVIAAGADVIIVGRGIYGKGEGYPTKEIVQQAEAYQQRLKQDA
ncbi:Orotidine 5'-phosphate decarboxylase [Cantharellus anzutake]|uniref:Orotidine 5'-phosphate decarboxylase n=1 Tax=Cantharellus anzutake TaxID=1750568 RepID=UPI00190880FA|nr:Orotidine 5'-phosphate decarboxylase [Cantharellus anzutake]KAF8339022.1 Orotidine 5'-phosphate decarboxylase [Cantharellus anzutake]